MNAYLSRFKGFRRYRFLILYIILSFCVHYLYTSTVSAARLEMWVVSTDVGRPHLVRAGTPTTFVISVYNDSSSQLPVSVSIQSEFPGQTGWVSRLYVADQLYRPLGTGSERLSLILGPQEVAAVLAELEPPPGLADGQEGRAVITAASVGTILLATEVRAKIRNQPKIYIIALDGCGAGYLYMDRKGNWYNGTAERLMPRANEFFQEAALLSDAHALLPAATDMNHSAVLSGSWPGTLGIPYVSFYFADLDPESGEPVYLPVSKNLMRWGADGLPIQTIFDLVKKDPVVGSPDAFTVFLSGKELVARLFRDGLGTVDILAGGSNLRPYYISEPAPYKLGDPPSDPDALDDRDGINLSPPEMRKMIPSSQARYFGNNPTKFPEDRWVAESAIQILYAEDPDVYYILMPECDDVQHFCGAADRPGEWFDPGTPDILWDDINIYNLNANRDPVLDVVHEADSSFGMFVAALKSNGRFGDSIVVLLADHGLYTLMGKPFLDLGQILLNSEVNLENIEFIQALGDSAWVYLKDPEKGAMIEAYLQAYETIHPVLEAAIEPLIVINRAEMDSGIDDVIGPFAEDGVPGNKRGELYSEWNIDWPVTDNSKVRWPDLYIMTRERFQFIAVATADLEDNEWIPWPGEPLLGTHSSPSSTWVPLAIHGPGIQSGVYHNRVTLADIAPTLYQLLGIEPPPHIDGNVIEVILGPRDNTYLPVILRNLDKN